MSFPPNQTLYINNIKESFSKNYRQAELKATLRNLCKPGEVIDIVSLGNFYDKGQAFVVMKSVDQAMAAMKKLQGYELEGQQIRVQYAKSKSHAVAKVEGTYAGHKRKQRPKPPTGSKGDDKKAKKDGMSEDESDDDKPSPATAPPPPAFVPPPSMAPPSGLNVPPPGFNVPPPTVPPPASGALLFATALGPTMPHPILFLENVPLNADADAVSALFRQFMGFKETRMVPSRPGLAFVEFENEMQSGVAMQRLQGVQMEGQAIKISFSKA